VFYTLINKVRLWVLEILMAILSKLPQEVVSNSGKSLFLLTGISLLETEKCVRLTIEEKKHGMTEMCFNLIYAGTGMKLYN